MKKITVSILTTLLMLSMVFSSSVFAANEEPSAWDSFLGLFNVNTSADDVGVEYRGHVQNKGDFPLDGSWIQGPERLGTVGESLRLEAFWIKLTDAPADLHIKYEVHVQNIGWMDPVEDGDLAGTQGDSLRIEAIKISLVDDAGVVSEDYSVSYRGHIQNQGDTAWFEDGDQLGTTGSSLRLEALEVKIEKITPDLDAYEAALAAVTQADYTTASWTTYQAVVNANVVDEDNVQSEVDAATAAITAAQANLVKVLKVESVSAINANQVKVTFSKAIDASTVISDTTTGALVSGGTGIVTIARSTAATDNVNKNVVSFATGFLSADGTVLTLTATSPTFFDGTYALTMSDKVKTAASEKLIAYAGTFTYADTVAPTVTALTYNAVTGQIEATIAEPLKAVPTIVRVNGSPVTGSAFVANSNQTKISIPKPASVLAGTTASVYIAGAADYADNQLTGFTGNVAITSDTTALAVESMTQSKSNQIKVVFNKSIASTDTVVDGATTVLMDGTAMSAANVVVTKDTTDTQNKTFLVTFTTAYVPKDYFYGTASTKTLVVTFTNDVVTDVFGQKLATSTTSVAMTKDVTGPVAASVKLSDDGSKFEVTFDEEIAATGTTANIILRKDGVAMSATATATRKAATGANAKVLVIGPNAADLVSSVIPAGTYQIRLNDSAIADPNTNNNTAQTLTLTVTGTATKLTAVMSNSANNKFLVTYSQAVTTASALNLANYTLDGAALPAATDIYFTDGTSKIVEIDLPAETVNIGVTGTPAIASLGVANVQTAAGLVVTATSGNVNVMDNTKPVLQSAKVLDNKTIELTYSEAMATVSAASAGDEFTIKQAGSVITLAAGELTATNVPGYSNKIRVTVAQGSDTPGTAEVNKLTVATGAVTASGNITVAFADGTVNDSRTVAVVNGTDTTATLVAAKIVASYTASPIAGYTVTASGADVIFTANAAAADKTVTGSIVDTDTTGVGATATITVVTPGVAPTAATVLNLNQTTTVETITPATANILDLAANAQKVGTTVTAN